MDKKLLSSLLAFAGRDTVIALASRIEQKHQVFVTKPPAKTMVMIEVREPVKSSRFFMGEMLATECFVEVDGIRGAAVMKGDDLEKTRAAAILDAAHTAEFEEFISASPELEAIRLKRSGDRQRNAAIHRQSQVNFKILEDSHEE